MSRLAIPIPDKNTSLQVWIRSLTSCFPKITMPVAPSKESDWRDWAKTFITNGRLSLAYPSRAQFPKDCDWRKWAISTIRLIQ